MQVTFATRPAPGRAGEDYVVATPDAVVVLDGAAPAEGVETGCVHGVRWYVRALGSRLAHLLGTRPDVAAQESLEAAIAGVTAAHIESCDPAHPDSPSCTVAAVRVRDDCLDWLVLADSTVLVDRPRRLHVVADPRVALAVQARREAARRGEHPRIRNIPGGYWVAADDPRAARESLTGSVPLAEVRSVVLLTDGASRPVDLFGQMTWHDCAALVRGRGPEALVAEVRRLEYADTDVVGRPRSKRYDDATAVLVVPDVDPHSGEAVGR